MYLSLAWSTEVNLGQQRLQGTSVGRDEGRCDFSAAYHVPKPCWATAGHVEASHQQLEPPTPIPRAELVPCAFSWE